MSGALFDRVVTGACREQLVTASSECLMQDAEFVASSSTRSTRTASGPAGRCSPSSNLLDIGFCGFGVRAGFAQTLGQFFPTDRDGLAGAKQVGMHGPGISTGKAGCPRCAEPGDQPGNQ